MSNSELINQHKIQNPFVIESHIEMPERNTSVSSMGKYKFLRTMRVGESFRMGNLTPGYTIKGLTQHCSYLKKNLDLGYSYRTVGGSMRNVLTWEVRIWRTA